MNNLFSTRIKYSSLPLNNEQQEEEEEEEEEQKISLFPFTSSSSTICWLEIISENQIKRKLPIPLKLLIWISSLPSYFDYQTGDGIYTCTFTQIEPYHLHFLTNLLFEEKDSEIFFHQLPQTKQLQLLESLFQLTSLFQINPFQSFNTITNNNSSFQEQEESKLKKILQNSTLLSVEKEFFILNWLKTNKLSTFKALKRCYENGYRWYFIELFLKEHSESFYSALKQRILKKKKYSSPATERNSSFLLKCKNYLCSCCCCFTSYTLIPQEQEEEKEEEEEEEESTSNSFYPLSQTENWPLLPEEEEENLPLLSPLKTESSIISINQEEEKENIILNTLPLETESCIPITNTPSFSPPLLSLPETTIHKIQEQEIDSTLIPGEEKGVINSTFLNVQDALQEEEEEEQIEGKPYSFYPQNTNVPIEVNIPHMISTSGEKIQENKNKEEELPQKRIIVTKKAQEQKNRKTKINKNISPKPTTNFLNLPPPSSSPSLKKEKRRHSLPSLQTSQISSPSPLPINIQNSNNNINLPFSLSGLLFNRFTRRKSESGTTSNREKKKNKWSTLTSLFAQGFTRENNNTTGNTVPLISPTPVILPSKNTDLSLEEEEEDFYISCSSEEEEEEEKEEKQIKENKKNNLSVLITEDNTKMKSSQKKEEEEEDIILISDSSAEEEEEEEEEKEENYSIRNSLIQLHSQNIIPPVPTTNNLIIRRNSILPKTSLFSSSSSKNFLILEELPGAIHKYRQEDVKRNDFRWITMQRSLPDFFDLPLSIKSIRSSFSQSINTKTFIFSKLILEIFEVKGWNTDFFPEPFVYLSFYLQGKRLFSKTQSIYSTSESSSSSLKKIPTASWMEEKNQGLQLCFEVDNEMLNYNLFEDPQTDNSHGEANTLLIKLIASSTPREDTTKIQNLGIPISSSTSISTNKENENSKACEEHVIGYTILHLAGLYDQMARSKWYPLYNVNGEIQGQIRLANLWLYDLKKFHTEIKIHPPEKIPLILEAIQVNKLFGRIVHLQLENIIQLENNNNNKRNKKRKSSSSSSSTSYEYGFEFQFGSHIRSIEFQPSIQLLNLNTLIASQSLYSFTFPFTSTAVERGFQIRLARRKIHPDHRMETEWFAQGLLKSSHATSSSFILQENKISTQEISLYPISSQFKSTRSIGKITLHLWIIKSLKEL